MHSRMIIHRLSLAALMGFICIAAGFLVPAPAAYAQAYCTTPNKPPNPPPPPKTPPPCKKKPCKACSLSPCYPASGVYTTDAVDLGFATASFPIVVARDYESGHSVDGPLGVGWVSSLTSRLYYATYLFSAPSTYSYEAHVQLMDGTVIMFIRNGDGSFTPTEGSKDTLVRNTDGTFDLRLGSLTFRYGVDGGLRSITDEFGNAMSYVYDTNGRVIRVQDDMGSNRYLDVAWGADGRISTVTDHSGRVVRYEYTAEGMLNRVTNPLNQTTTLTYTPGRFTPLLTSIEDHWGRVITELEWYSDDRLKSYTEGEYTGVGSAGEKYTYNYLGANFQRVHSLGSTTNAVNSSTWFVTRPDAQFNGEGQQIAASQDGTTEAFTYDAQGRMTALVRGGVWFKITYDTTFPQRVASFVPYTSDTYQTLNTDWAAQFYVYYQPGEVGAGMVKEVQQQRTDGVTKDWTDRYAYDTKGRLTSVTEVSGYTTTIGYNAASEPISVTTPTGTSTYEYDTLGRLTKAVNEMGQETTYTYDVLDRMLTQTLPKPTLTSPAFTTTYTHDVYDSVTGLTYTVITDPNGFVTKEGNDALGNTVEHIDALNAVTRFNYQYNLLDNITDANGNVTRFVYNSSRTHTSTIFPDGKSEAYSLNGTQLVTKTDRAGIASQYLYDSFGRITSIIARINNQVVEQTTYTYTGQKLMSSAYTKNGVTDTTSYTYDSLYRMLTETQGDRAKITFGYGTSTADLLRSYAIGPVSGGTTASASYTYDTKARLKTISWSKMPGDVTFSYNALDQTTEIAFPTGHRRTYTYDGQGRLTSIWNKAVSGGTLARYTYNYDRDWTTNTLTMLGQVTSVDVTASSPLQQPVGTTKYGYDHKYQLVRTDYPGGTLWDAWTYDAVGNRTAYQNQTQTRTYTYYANAAGGSSLRLRRDGGTDDLLYDDNGNYLGRSSNSIRNVFDAQNRMTHEGTQVEAVYDALGRRVKASTDGPVGKTFWYMGDQVIAEKTAGWNLDNQYLMGPGIDQPLAATFTDGHVEVFVVDGQGSVLGLVDVNDVPSSTMHYSPFGMPLQGSPHDAPIFGYTAREKSPTDANRWYYRNRHYEPRIGRFVSEDPIQQYMHVVGADRYSYASNSPMNYTDPLGLAPCKWNITGGAWQSTGAEIKIWFKQTGAQLDQVPIVNPPGTNWIVKKILGGKGGKLPLSIKFIMTCTWQRKRTITNHYKRKIKITLYCACPEYASVWFDEETKSESKTQIMGGAITQSSWKNWEPMQPCPPPK